MTAKAGRFRGRPTWVAASSTLGLLVLAWVIAGGTPVQNRMKTSRKERKGRKERTELCAKAADAFVGQTVHDSLNAVLEPDFAEIIR